MLDDGKITLNVKIGTLNVKIWVWTINYLIPMMPIKLKQVIMVQTCCAFLLVSL